MSTRHYIGIVEPRERNWSISFPPFPGTVTVGDSFADAMAHARDALASVVEAMEEDGHAIPEGFDRTAGPAEYSLGDYRNPHIVLVPVEARGRTIRIDVTMYEGLVSRLDSLADRAQSSSSALLARGARMVLAAETQE